MTLPEFAAILASDRLPTAQEMAEFAMEQGYRPRMRGGVLELSPRMPGVQPTPLSRMVLKVIDREPYRTRVLEVLGQVPEAPRALVIAPEPAPELVEVCRICHREVDGELRERIAHVNPFCEVGWAKAVRDGHGVEHAASLGCPYRNKEHS